MIQEKIQWQPVIELSIVLFTILGSTIPLYLHTDSKMEESRRETNILVRSIQEDVKAIREDIREFHGRLCTVEERNKKS